jgi:hypothetical protein
VDADRDRAEAEAEAYLARRGINTVKLHGTHQLVRTRELRLHGSFYLHGKTVEKYGRKRAEKV